MPHDATHTLFQEQSSHFLPLYMPFPVTPDSLPALSYPVPDGFILRLSLCCVG